LNRKLPKFGADRNVAAVERLAAAVAAVQHSFSVFSVKGIRNVRFLIILLFIGFDSEINCDLLWLEGKETDVTCIVVIANFNK